MPSQSAIAKALLHLHGHGFAEEIGIPLQRNTPAPLFRWLVAALLFSTRIRAGKAVAAAKALSKAGWRTPQAMAAASWADRVEVLNRAGYARYDESTARMLGATARQVLDSYRGDLRRLRKAAGENPQEERRLLQAFEGIGATGAAIFLREVQAVWPEVYPFADPKALSAARALGLPGDAQDLAELVPPGDFTRLVAALVRSGLAKDHDRVVEVAAGIPD